MVLTEVTIAIIYSYSNSYTIITVGSYVAMYSEIVVASTVTFTSKGQWNQLTFSVTLVHYFIINERHRVANIAGYTSTIVSYIFTVCMHVAIQLAIAINASGITCMWIMMLSGVAR